MKLPVVNLCRGKNVINENVLCENIGERSETKFMFLPCKMWGKNKLICGPLNECRCLLLWTTPIYGTIEAYKIRFRSMVWGKTMLVLMPFYRRNWNVSVSFSIASTQRIYLLRCCSHNMIITQPNLTYWSVFIRY